MYNMQIENVHMVYRFSVPRQVSYRWLAVDSILTDCPKSGCSLSFIYPLGASCPIVRVMYMNSWYCLFWLPRVQINAVSSKPGQDSRAEECPVPAVCWHGTQILPHGMGSVVGGGGGPLHEDLCWDSLNLSDSSCRSSKSQGFDYFLSRIFLATWVKLMILFLKGG